jgi:bifunctional DNA-binding transcriptional regulator/antitoxin component of YhaV-PrlF toxin-antitoxin module
MTTTVKQSGTIQLPRNLLKQQKVRVGDHLEVIADENDPGVIVLRRLPKVANEGLAQWLRSCPFREIRIPKRRRDLPR